MVVMFLILGRVVISITGPTYLISVVSWAIAMGNSEVGTTLIG